MSAEKIPFDDSDQKYSFTWCLEEKVRALRRNRTRGPLESYFILIHLSHQHGPGSGNLTSSKDHGCDTCGRVVASNNRVPSSNPSNTKSLSVSLYYFWIISKRLRHRKRGQEMPVKNKCQPILVRGLRQYIKFSTFLSN